MSEMDTLYGSSQLYTQTRIDLTPVYSAKYGHTLIPLALNAPGSPYGAGWHVAGPGHYFCCGAARSGKGAGCIVPALLTYPYNCVVVDVRGENLWVTGEYRGRSPDHPNGGLGHRVIALDAWDECNRRYGSKAGVTVPLSTFNPLSIVDPYSPDFADQVSQLAQILIVAGQTEPHWPESARELVGGLIAAVVEAAVIPRPGANALPEAPTFREVREILTKSDEELALYVRRVCKLMPDSVAARKLARFAESTREVSSIRSTAITQTAILDASRLLSVMDTGPDAFDIKEIATGRVSLYLVLPFDKLNSHGRWLTMMLQLAMQTAMMAGGSQDRPCLFILDELGTITPGFQGGGMPVVSQALGLAAGNAVRLMCFYQDLGQVIRDYPSSWETFFANSALVQVLRVNDNTTAQYFSQRLGTKTIKHQRSFNSPTEYHGRQVMLPAEIMALRAGETLLLYTEGRNVRLIPAASDFDL